MKECRKCHVQKSVSEFWANPRNSDLLQSYCKECMRIQHREYQKRNYNYIRKDPEWGTRVSVVRELKNHPCMDCGQTYSYWVMHFDHRDGETKTACVNHLIKSHRPLDAILREAEKCDLVCANCHAIRTHDRHINYYRDR